MNTPDMNGRETREMLAALNVKMDTANDKLDELKAVAARSGGIAGAVAGGVSGGVVAVGVAFIKAKLGL